MVPIAPSRMRIRFVSRSRNRSLRLEEEAGVAEAEFWEDKAVSVDAGNDWFSLNPLMIGRSPGEAYSGHFAPGTQWGGSNPEEGGWE
jgi:hypothetical protein